MCVQLAFRYFHDDVRVNKFIVIKFSSKVLHSHNPYLHLLDLSDELRSSSTLYFERFPSFFPPFSKKYKYKVE